MSSLIVAGDTSGSVTLQAPAIAGSTTLTLPTTTGTVALLSDTTMTTLVNNVTVGTGTSVTYSGLTLTNYKFLQIVFNGVTYSANKGSLAITSTGDQAHTIWDQKSAGSTQQGTRGILTLDLASGYVTGLLFDPLGSTSADGGFKPSNVTSTTTSPTIGVAYLGSIATGYSTATTSIVFTLWGGTVNFAGGTISIYGLK